MANAPRVQARNWSLATRLTAWYTLASFATVLTAVVLLYVALASNIDREDDHKLASKAHALVALLQDRPGDLRGIRQEVELGWASRKYAQLYVRVMDQHGSPVAESPTMAQQLPQGVFPAPVTAQVPTVQGTEHRAEGGTPYRLLAVNTSAPGTSYTVQVALNRTQEHEILAEYQRLLVFVLAGALGVCALVGHAIARWGIKPVASIAQAAGRVRMSTLHERIDREGLPSELVALAGTFNEMLDRLEGSFAHLSRFSADIAHELRTPVNNLRGEMEVALSRARTTVEYQDVIGSSLEECQRLSRIIDSLLFLARAESPAPQTVSEPVNVHLELETVREFYDAAAAEAGVRLEVQAAGGAEALVDRTLFQRAVSNLVSNAIAHTPVGGIVRLAAVQAPGELRVEVSDTGSGIPAEHVEHVCEPFYRVDGSRTSTSGGMGLGLAIVKRIATLHDGKIEVVSQPSEGTRVAVVLPQPEPARQAAST